MARQPREAGGPDCDVVVIGAGFGGLYALHRLGAQGFSVQGLERAPDVGGVWYWNAYPGARCDCESYYYSYGFSEALQAEWRWSLRYSEQPEIRRYLSHVADRFDVRRKIRFGVAAEAAEFDEGAGLWRVRTSDGDTIACRYLVTATGNLSRPHWPDLPGLADFQGRVFHTAQWPQGEVDFTGRRVAVLGTGASAVQLIPRIAPHARRLTVLQRTASWVLPAWNRPTDPDFDAWVRDNYDEIRRKCMASPGAVPFDTRPVSALAVSEAERRAVYQRLWDTGGMRFFSAFNDLFSSPEANATAQAFVADKIREIVADPVTAAALIPRDQPIGVKRPPVDDNYYATFNRETVDLVNLADEPITGLGAHAISTPARDVEIDDLVLATGFDAITGALLAMDIRGRGGARLADAWARGPAAYLGLSVAGFPNLFMITGPLSPSVLANMPTAVEQHTDWICDCIRHAAARGVATVEATAEAQAEWVSHAEEVVGHTLYAGSRSWYFGSNIPGKPSRFGVYVGGFDAYRSRCDAEARAGYPGFALAPAAA